MQKVLMMMQKGCPYCRQALSMMDEFVKKHPEYADVEVRIVDENEDKRLADSLDYWYVPTYYVGDTKVHEGVPSEQSIKNVYEQAAK